MALYYESVIYNFDDSTRARSASDRKRPRIGGIDGGGRLGGENFRRFCDNRSSDCDALLLAAAKLSRCLCYLPRSALLQLEAAHDVAAFVSYCNGTVQALQSGLGIFIAECCGFLVIRSRGAFILRSAAPAFGE